jgi:hypothetical protein
LLSSGLEPFLDARVGGYRLANLAELWVFGEGSICAGLVSEWFSSVLCHTFLGLGIFKELRECVVDQHISKRDLVTHGEAASTHDVLDAAHPPTKESFTGTCVVCRLQEQDFGQ